MPSVRIDKPDDPRFKLLGATLSIDWRLARSLLIDVWSHMTDEQSWILKPQIIDAIAGVAGFHQALIAADLATLEQDGRVRILDEDAPFGRIEWLGDMRSAKQRGGKARAANANRDEAGRMAPSNQQESSSAPADDQQESSSAPADHPANPAIGIDLKVKDLSQKANSEDQNPDDASGATSDPPPAGKSSKKRLRGIRREYPPELEAVYAEYPRKERKTQGMALLERDLTAADYPDFRDRVRAYVARMRSKGKLEYLLNWKNLALEWRDLELDPAVATSSGSTGYRYTFEDDDGTEGNVDV